MKRAIIALSVISFIFCSFSSCDEEDYSKCSTHEVDHENFSCYQMNFNDSLNCSVFPDNIDSQKAAFKYLKSYRNEILSGFYFGDLEEDLLEYYPEKESYQKGEEIIIKSKRMSDDDISIFSSKKTCAYQLYGRFMESMLNLEDDKENFKGYVNVEDKNSCFNAQQFSGLKDIIGCGYAEIKYINEDNKEYNIKSCFYVPTIDTPEDLYSYLKIYFIDGMVGNILASYIFSLETSTTSYEIIVEDKKGIKFKYKSGSNDIEVIENGKQDEKDEKDEEVKKGRRRSASNIYNISKLNIILFICLILFSS